MYKKQLLAIVIGVVLLSVAAVATQYKGGPFDPNQIPNFSSFVVVISTDDDDEELSLQPQSPLGPVGAATPLFKWNPLLLKNGKRPQVPYALTLLAFKPEEFESFNGKLNLDPDTLKSHLVYFASGLSKTELQYPAKAPRLQPELIYAWFIHTVYDGYLFTSDKAGVFCYVKLFCPRHLEYAFPPPVDLRVKSLQAAWDAQTSVQIAATITNDGDSNAPAFHVLFQADGESVSQCVPGLAAHTDLDLTVVIPLTAAPPFEVKVTVDYLDEVTETNEANNSAVFTVY